MRDQIKNNRKTEIDERKGEMIIMVNRFENRCALNERLFSVKKNLIDLNFFIRFLSHFFFCFSNCPESNVCTSQW